MLLNRRNVFIPVLLILAFSLFAKPGFSQISLDERRETFEQVWSIINEKYYDANFHGVDWQAARDRYRQQIEQSESEEEFYELLDKMVGELRDSHTRFYSPQQRSARKGRQTAQVGFKLGEIQGKTTVLDLSPDSEASRLGVKPGMILLSVDGQPIEKALEAARQFVGVSSSERSTRMRVYSRLLAGDIGSELKLELADAKGKVLKVNLLRQTGSAETPLQAKILPSGFGYLKFNQFVPSVAGQVEQALREFKLAPGLILDFRGNPGGDGETGLKIAGYFFNDEIEIARLVTRTGKPPAPEIPMILKAGSNGGQVYSKSLIILVDEASASTTELITNAMQEHGRAEILGSQSCGCVLGILNYREIKGGGGLTISEFGFISPKGRKLEGSGVLPDKSIKLTLKELRSGRDVMLEAAVGRLARLTKSKN